MNIVRLNDLEHKISPDTGDLILLVDANGGSKKITVAELMGFALNKSCDHCGSRGKYDSRGNCDACGAPIVIKMV